jgi:aspartate carbamoyltransferase catalytic subunit
MAQHLLAIEGMPRSQIEALLQRASQWRSGELYHRPLNGRVVANLFYEPSTRTRSSFEIAAASLGAHVLNWTVAGSSASKGETLVDTARNIAAMGPAAIVVRHASSGAAQLVASRVKCAVINAGDGQHEHPSQALLDAFVLQQRWGSFEGKRVVIVGDLLHSRVARSGLHCLQTLGAKVTFCGPPTLLPAHVERLGVDVTFDFDEALSTADAVMMLRLQRERQHEALVPAAHDYTRRYGLTVQRAKALKPNALVLHPGPINRGLEIDPEVADGPSSVILHQVADGVAVRRAILEAAA